MFIDRFIHWAYGNLLEDDDAQAYLRGRGISAEQWEKYRIGYVSGDFDVDPAEDPAHGEDCADREKKLLRCDVCRYRSWSSLWQSDVEDGPKTRYVGRRLRGCVVFPLTSYSGAFVGFQTRSIFEKVYDTFVVKRRPEAFFFGTAPAMESIWSTREVNLVEGPGDALVLSRLYAPNTLALTTSAPNKLQLQFLRRFAHTIHLYLDLDKAGRDGVSSFIRYNADSFRQVRDVKYSHIKGGKDVGDLWKQIGDDAFRRHILKVSK